MSHKNENCSGEPNDLLIKIFLWLATACIEDLVPYENKVTGREQDYRRGMAITISTALN